METTTKVSGTLTFEDARDALLEIIKHYVAIKQASLIGEVRYDEQLSAFGMQEIESMLDDLEAQDKIFWDEETNSWVADSF